MITVEAIAVQRAAEQMALIGGEKWSRFAGSVRTIGMDVLTRFWSKVRRADSDGCWEWTASTTPRGYGQFNLGSGKNRPAHRVAWELVNGPIPPGMMVLHRCDNRRCVRADPDPRLSHLFLGTAHDNTQDMLAKGRNDPCRGERSGNHKLTWSVVEEARGAWMSGVGCKRLARAYGVHPVTLYRALTGATWRRH